MLLLTWLCRCSDQEEVMSVLLQSGAQVNMINSSQCSALHIAVNKQHSRCVHVLLRHGCNVNVQVSQSFSRVANAPPHRTLEPICAIRPNPIFFGGVGGRWR